MPAPASCWPAQGSHRSCPRLPDGLPRPVPRVSPVQFRTQAPPGILAPMPTGLRELKKQRTRAAIQAAALALIERQGYDATTCEQISAAAEVSPATFFRYFPT